MKHPSTVALAAALALTAAVGATAQPLQRPAYRREVPARLVAQARVSEDSARAVALARIPGGVVQALELEREGGRLIYSWDIKVAGRPGIEEVHVDARDGQVVKVEHERPGAALRRTPPVPVRRP
jgi:uncharacterized membrane protein YkoI